VIDFIIEYIPLYVTGALVGLAVALLAFAGSLVIGLSAALGRISGKRWLRWITGTYVALFRGMPPLVLLYIVYFGLPAWAHQLGNSTIDAIFAPLGNRIFAAAVAFAFNSGAYGRLC
jgi:His/Glu/Gln/Arg/opine family amino acid ABC transporter permease subunit